MQFCMLAIQVIGYVISSVLQSECTLDGRQYKKYKGLSKINSMTHPTGDVLLGLDFLTQLGVSGLARKLTNYVVRLFSIQSISIVMIVS